MKVLGWILLCAVSTAQAQQLIEPAPLSVEDDGTRKIIENGGMSIARPEVRSSEAVIAPPPAEALVIPNDEVINPTTPMTSSPTNPKDGQLKLEGEKSNEKTPDIQNIEVLAFEYYDSPLKKYLQFSFGYINSRYEKIHPSLENGSLQTAFKFVADVNRHYQTGFAVEVLSDTSNQKIPDNIRVLQYRLFVDYHAPFYSKGAIKLDWVTGLSFSIGDFGVKRRFRNSQGEEVSVNLKDGTIVGLIPAGGIRIYLVGQNSFDLMAEYHQYFGNPQKYIGGLAISPRLNFEF